MRRELHRFHFPSVTVVSVAVLAALAAACGSGRNSNDDAADPDGQRDADAEGATEDVAELADVGEVSDADETGPCGFDMALIEHLGVCIDRYEASRGPDGRALSVSGVIPWTEIAWGWAGGACHLAGKRLCTSDEWGAACGGPDDLSLPWGDFMEFGRCANGGLPEVQPGGSFPDCEGWYSGVYDLIGNASEWTSTWNNPVDGPSGYIIRGGTVHGNDGDNCYSTGYTGFPEETLPQLGFRCCRDLE